MAKRAPAAAPVTLADGVLAAWQTNARCSAFLVEHLPARLWSASVPQARRTIGSIAVHLHNSRSRWVRTLGREHGIRVPPLLGRSAGRAEVLKALPRSAQGIADILSLGLDHGGVVPPSAGYVWRNLPLDVAHVLTYFSAHEAHHRGQIIALARILGQRLPAEAVNGVWLWHLRRREPATPVR
ncbi:MAG: DinB family protein [Gemmatimonadales bacterium]